MATKNKSGSLPRETAAQRKANAKIGKSAPKLAKPETINTVVGVRNSSKVLVKTSADRSILISRMDAKTTKLAKVGSAVAPLDEYLKAQPKPIARMAHGTDAHTAPHSAKAIADQKREASKSASKGKAQAKAPKAAKAKAGGDYTYKPTKKPNTAKPDSLRGRMIALIMTHTSTADAKAAAVKAKLPINSGWFNWAAANGYITK